MTPSESVAASRQLSTDAAAEPLDALPLDEDTVLAGRPGAGLRQLGLHGSAEIGLWGLTPGTVTDVESDEVFVVVAGRGTLTFDDGSAIALRPGAVVRLVDGDRTTWEIAETLRKVYVA